MPAARLVLDVCRVNGNTTSALLGRLVDVSVVGELRASLLCEDFGDSRSQSGLSMVDMSCTPIRELGDRVPSSPDVPMVPMFMCGLARENFWAAASAYPRRATEGTGACQMRSCSRGAGQHTGTAKLLKESGLMGVGGVPDSAPGADE